MSISSELLTLNTTKANINSMINAKGVTVTDEPFAQYPDKVRLIPNGGGVYESNIILFLEGRMRNVDIPYGTTRIGGYTFYGFVEEGGPHNLKSATIPDTVTYIGKSAFGVCIGLTTITIPASVTSIDDYAFSSCTNLNEIVCLATVPPSLGEYPFNNTNDCPIYVPDNNVLEYQVTWTDYASRITPISQRQQ